MMAEKDKFGYMFEGTARKYVTHLRNQLFLYRAHFQNIHSAWNEHEFNALRGKPNHFIFELGRIFLKPGDNVVELMGQGVEFPATFSDGSILSISQTFEETKDGCYIDKSVIAFYKVMDDRVVYLFHYDSQQGVPNHPDYHLQFDFDNTINTPRFNIGSYESVGTILEMIIRDQLI